MDLEIYSKLTTVFTLWTLAVNRFGFQLKTTHIRNFLNTHNEYFNHFCSLEENYRQLVKRIGIEPDKRFKFPGLKPEKRDEEWAKPFIVINNTFSELALVWKLPEAQLKAICEWILTQTGYQIAFCGAPGDYAENQSFINKTW